MILRLDQENETANKQARILIVLALFGAFMFSGCTTKVFYITESKPDFSFNKTDRFSIVLKDKPLIISGVMLGDKQTGVEDIDFAALLKTKLLKHGFLVAEGDPKPADLLVSFRLDERTHTHTSTRTYTTYETQRSYSSGYIGDTYYRGSTTQLVPRTNTYTHTDISIDKTAFVSIMGKKGGKERSGIVWSGYLSAAIDDYRAMTDCIVDVLVQLIGKNNTGYIEIDKYCEKTAN
ncbi:MAG: hypothetical protein LBN32_00025 [Helicobacteraceae bacterium]|jgi:hypothetical protein|nr:hypothetical protein [Helicobacteraceae bacterium]